MALDLFVSYQHVISTSVANTTTSEITFLNSSHPLLAFHHRVSRSNWLPSLTSRAYLLATDCPLETRPLVDKLFDRFGCPWQGNEWRLATSVVGNDVNNTFGLCFGLCLFTICEYSLCFKSCLIFKSTPNLQPNKQVRQFSCNKSTH